MTLTILRCRALHKAPTLAVVMRLLHPKKDPRVTGLPLEGQILRMEQLLAIGESSPTAFWPLPSLPNPREDLQTVTEIVAYKVISKKCRSMRRKKVSKRQREADLMEGIKQFKLSADRPEELPHAIVSSDVVRTYLLKQGNYIEKYIAWNQPARDKNASCSYLVTPDEACCVSLGVSYHTAL